MRRPAARVLMQLYPRAWKSRYGAEFADFLEGCDGGLRTWLNVVWSALGEHIVPAQGGSMQQRPDSFRTVLQQPSAFFPLVMSLVALAVVLGYVARYGGGPAADEGTVGHLWQLLMAGQVPIIVIFAAKWLRRSPKQALYVMAQQAGAALASAAAVFFFHLG